MLDEDRLEKARKMMGAVAEAVQAGARTGLVTAVPEFAPKPAQRETTLRAESLVLDHCRINTKRTIVRTPSGEERKVYVLNVVGQLDAHSFSEFDEYLGELISQDRSRIVLNFARLTYISSAGLGVLSGRLQEARERGGNIVLCEIPEDLHKILQMVGMHEVMDIVETEKEAIESLAAR